MENNNTQNQYNELNGRIIRVETEVQDVKNDISELKENSKKLEKSQTDTIISLKETNGLLSKNIELMGQTLRQNTIAINQINTTLNRLKEETDVKFEKVNEKLDNKKDTFKDFLIDISKSVLKLAISGGLLYILYEIGKGQITNIFM